MNIDLNENFLFLMEYEEYNHMNIYPTGDTKENLHRVGQMVQNQDLKRK